MNQDTALAKTLSVLKDAEAEGRRFVMTIEGTGEEVSLGSGINETAIKIIVEARLAKKFYTIKTEPDQTAPDGGTNLSTATAENHHSADTRRATKNNHVTTTGTTDPEESENNISFRDSNGNPEEDETTNTVDTFNSKPKATARGCRAQLKKKNISSAVGATNDPSDATDVSLSTPEKKHAAWSLQNSKGSAAINADRPSLEEAGEAKESGDDTTDKTEDTTDKTEAQRVKCARHICGVGRQIGICWQSSSCGVCHTFLSLYHCNDILLLIPPPAAPLSFPQPTTSIAPLPLFIIYCLQLECFQSLSYYCYY